MSFPLRPLDWSRRIAVLLSMAAGWAAFAAGAQENVRMPPSSRRAHPPVGDRSLANVPAAVAGVDYRRRESGIERPYRINLPTALRLANAQAIDVRIASEKIRVAAAQLQQARVLWLPTILVGPNYYRHDGPIQDIQGNIINTSKSAFLMGAGPILVFSTNDALFAPLAQQQTVRAQQALGQAAQNDTMLAVMDVYFQVQQARGELAGAQDARAKAEDLVRRVEQLAEVLVPPFEKRRAETELARRTQSAYLAQERWRVASAELNRLLRLNPTTVLEPMEPPHLQIPLIDATWEVDDLIRMGLNQRPELRAHQSMVQATLKLLQKERLRPLMPSVLLRGASTGGVLGTLPAGIFGGGVNGNVGNFGVREDYDLQVLWELQNLGFGNRASIRQKQSENRVAMFELFRIQDRVAAEVVQAQAQVQTTAGRLQAAASEVEGAVVSAQENLNGFRQTRKVGDLPVLITRPQEVVAAIQALALAYNDYYAAVADFNRAQFRLYRAIGNAPGAVERVLPSDAGALRGGDRQFPGRREPVPVRNELPPPAGAQGRSAMRR